MISVGIIGASGYTGEELVKILQNHPQVEIQVLTSRTHNGEKITDIFETGFIFISEYCLGLNLKRKNWKEDMLSIAGHLKGLLRLVNNEK